MTPATTPSPPTRIHNGAEKAITLALTLAQAERAILEFSESQVDAIVDTDGNAYLLRPAQEHLRQNERRLQAMIDGAADVITVVNRGGTIVSQNPAALRVLGHGHEEMVGRSFFDLIHEQDLPAVYSAFFNVIENFTERSTVQFRHRAGDGSYRLIQATAGSCRDGSSTSAVFSLRPITNPALVWSESAGTADTLSADRFLAMVAHELRAPLAPVLLGIDELQEEAGFAESEATFAMMRRNLDLQARLIAELADYTSIGQHKVRLHIEAIDAHETIHFVEEVCRAELVAAQVELQLDLRSTGSRVLADALRLQQVLWNLVKNAIKFSPPGSTVFIRTVDGPPDRLIVEVADQGIGIEPALLPLVFDCYRQGDHAAQGGLGLGLFIAKGMAEAQGGTLTAHSAGDGHGSTFRLRLLKAPPEPIATRAELSPGNSLSPFNSLGLAP